MRLHEFTTKQELDEIGVGLAARYLAKRIAQAAAASRKGPPKPDEAITKKAPETISQNKQAAQQRIDQHYGGKPQLVQSPKPSNNPGTIKSLQTTSSKRPMPASTKQPANEATKSKGDLADELSDMLPMLRQAKEAGDLVKVEQLKQKINKIKKQMFEPIKERKLSKKEVKTRDKYADDLPDKEFKKRYGKDWESVKYATATKMAKKKNESTDDKDVANYVSETDTKIS
jgi:hypothetical protein